MILICPQCTTRYTVDESKFPPQGRNVRCAKCGHVWHQAPVAAPDITMAEIAAAAESVQPQAPQAYVPATEPPPPRPEPAAPQRAAYVAAPQIGNDAPDQDPLPPPAQHVPRRFPIAAVAGWAGLVLAILIIGWAGVSYRQNIAMLWPRTASLYAALGLDVNPRGLAFADVAYHREVQDGQAVLAVTGKLVNIGDRIAAVPEIMVALSDGQRRELYHWSFAASVSTLRPGQAVPFLTRLSSPPAGAKHLEVRFAGGE